MSKLLKEIESWERQGYRFQDTKNGIKIINMNTNTELPEGPDKDRILAIIEMISIIGEYSVFERHTDGIQEFLDNNTTFFDEQYDKLEQFILQTFRTGNTVVANNEYQCHDIGQHFLNRMGGFGFCDNSLDANSREEVIRSKKLINYILNCNGLKLTDLKIEFQGKKKPEKISWSTEKLSLKENLNPNNPQYTRSDKTKKIISKRRSKKKSIC